MLDLEYSDKLLGSNMSTRWQTQHIPLVAKSQMCVIQTGEPQNYNFQHNWKICKCFFLNKSKRLITVLTVQLKCISVIFNLLRMKMRLLLYQVTYFLETICFVCFGPLKILTKICNFIVSFSLKLKGVISTPNRTAKTNIVIKLVSRTLHLS